MKPPSPWVLLLVFAIGAAYYLTTREVPSPPRSPPPAAVTVPGQTPAAPAVAPVLEETPSRPAAPAAGPAAAADTAAALLVPPAPAPVEPLSPELAGLAPALVLENMRTCLRLYGEMFGGNPVGTNPEITAALAGNNPKHLNFLKADGNRVNARGELVDPWGTPYFFHQLSGHQTEIRSAGPDRVLYTLDDLVVR